MACRAAPTLPAAEQWLQERSIARYRSVPWVFDENDILKQQTFAFPVALIFVRGDRKGDGQRVCDQVLASFRSWAKDSGGEIEIVLAGWTQDRSGDLLYSSEDFMAFKERLEDQSRWRYSGDTDLLVASLQLTLDGRGQGYWAWDFSEAIALRLEQMLWEKRIGSVDGFLSSLFREPAGSAGPSAVKRVPTWMVSDRVAIQGTQKGFMDAFTRIVLARFADVFMGATHVVAQDLNNGEQRIHVLDRATAAVLRPRGRSRLAKLKARHP